MLSNTLPVVPPISHTTTITKADSGATRHYFTLQDAHTLQNLSNTPGPVVALPNNNTFASTQQGYLPCTTKLSKSAKQAHVFPGLRNTSLISLEKLCDDNCWIILNKNSIYVLKNNHIVLTGNRNKIDGLWDIPLNSAAPQQPEKCNVIITKNKVKNDLISFLHACCFSPNISTFIKAVKNGNFIMWPGLTTSIITKHLHPSIATAKGHLDQEQANLQSTQTTESDDNIDECFSPTK